MTSGENTKRNNTKSFVCTHLVINSVWPFTYITHRATTRSRSRKRKERKKRKKEWRISVARERKIYDNSSSDVATSSSRSRSSISASDDHLFRVYCVSLFDFRVSKTTQPVQARKSRRINEEANHVVDTRRYLTSNCWGCEYMEWHPEEKKKEESMGRACSILGSRRRGEREHYTRTAVLQLLIYNNWFSIRRFRLLDTWGKTRSRAGSHTKDLKILLRLY